MKSSFLCVALVACVAVAALALVDAQPPSGPVTNLPLLPAGSNLKSWSGYITVDETNGANLFYWMFENSAGNTQPPLLIWLNGGPGSSSMYGLFSENGPFYVSEDGSELVLRNTSWSQQYDVVFIDNPVGTGFSYTQNANGFVTDEEEVGADLLQFLYTFYELYPERQSQPLYICGESYAGKYVPAFSYAIHTANQEHKKYAAAHPSRMHHARKHHKDAKHSPRSPAPHNLPNAIQIPLTGISIGDGMIDPLTQVPGYGQLLFGLSLIDMAQRDYMVGVENSIVQMIQNEQWLEAFETFDPLMMGDFYPYGSYFNNATGLTDYYNFDSPTYPNNPFESYLNRADVKAALNVDPSFVYSSGNSTVEQYLKQDWMKSVAPWLVVLLENYPVMIYNGQNDVILAAPGCEAFLRQLQWNGSASWLVADRLIWKVNSADSDPAGYVRHQGDAVGLTYVIVREAGHLVPQDQPERAYDMITRFVSGVMENKILNAGNASSTNYFL